MTTTPAAEHLVLTIEEAAVESVRIGRLRRIPIDALESFLHQLRAANPDSVV